MRTFEEIKTTVETGLGKHICDLKLENVQLVNVFSGEIYPSNIFVKDSRIVSIDPDVKLEAVEVIDGQGAYAIPGFIDAHMHFESTMLSPEALSNEILPHGTTTICADLMEIANVAGAEGLEVMLRSIEDLPYRMIIEVPSRVPTAPGLETTGAILDAHEVAKIMDWPESVSLGELDPSKILFVQEEYLHKVADTLARRKIVNGHAIGRHGQELNVYASSGISDDHECVTIDELTSRLRVGLKVMIREGSTERNVDELISGVLEHNLPTDNLMFCTDDKQVQDIRNEGHINYNVSKAIKLGMEPMTAIKLATINSAKHFRLEDEIGSITPGRLADILLVTDLNKLEPSHVFFEGKLVAQEGALLESCHSSEYPAWILDTVKLKNPITDQSFALPAKGTNKTTKVRVIDLVDKQIINRSASVILAVSNGLIEPSVSEDILKLAVVERYGKTGGVGVAFVRGFGLDKGALAYSMSHDHHNIVVVGTNDADMALAVNTVHEDKGGLSAVCNGEVLARMSLPIGGLMSPLSSDDVMKGVEIMNDAARKLGCTLPSPYMTLSFISLPTVPAMGLTDFGLIDVLQHKLIEVEII